MCSVVLCQSRVRGSRGSQSAHAATKGIIVNQAASTVTPLRPCLFARPCRYGEFTAYAFRSLLEGMEHLALVAGRVSHAEGCLVRVHSEGMLGDIFGSSHCNSGGQLDAALQQIAEEVGCRDAGARWLRLALPGCLQSGCIHCGSPALGRSTGWEIRKSAPFSHPLSPPACAAGLRCAGVPAGAAGVGTGHCGRAGGVRQQHSGG